MQHKYSIYGNVHIILDFLSLEWQWHDNLQLLATPSDFKSRHGLGLHYIHLNVRSLVPKRDLGKIWANTANADIIIMSGTWLKNSVYDQIMFRCLWHGSKIIL